MTFTTFTHQVQSDYFAGLLGPIPKKERLRLFLENIQKLAMMNSGLISETSVTVDGMEYHFAGNVLDGYVILSENYRTHREDDENITEVIEAFEQLLMETFRSSF